SSALKVFGWLGLQGDVAIEDRRVSKGIERAQKKVEERNFETRKNLLEYDEVMDIQRHAFYGQRQNILEGRDLQGMVKEMCRRATAEAVGNYLGGDYRKRCIAEWVRLNLQFNMDAAQVRADSIDDLDNLEANLRNRAKEEASSVIAMTLGEYMDEELEQREWDLRGLASWAESRFQVDISQGQLRKMTPPEVEVYLRDAAAEKIDQIDLSPLGRFLAADFPARSLVEWARAKFGLALDPTELPPDRGGVQALLIEKVEQAYARREIESPVEYAIEITIGPAGTENVYAVGSLADWANRKYDAGLAREEFLNAKVEDVYPRLVAMSEQWLAGGRLEQCVREKLGSDPSIERGIVLAAERFDTTLTPASFKGDVATRVIEVGREFLRREMTALERYILLQIYDSSWKDHLLAMDHLKSGIGLRGYAEQDPRVAYKREGSRQFREMLSSVQEKVTDMIFKVRLTAQTQMSSVYQISNTVHEQLSGYDHLARDMADQQAAAAPQKVETIIREAPRVGRNDSCPCGSGKKYKKCHGKAG
ncbi:MAG: SEC-C metal-binding domain-containing protein, partial [Planctomycetota bacterium]